MRCRRCHTRLAPGKKTCPVCGTLILKRRGSVRLAASAGGSRIGGIADSLSGIDGRKLLVAVIAVIAVVCAVCMIAGCGSCGSCASCDSCTACASCGSCSSCGSCAACGSSDDSDVSFPERTNGGKMSTEYFIDSTLYYVNGGYLMSTDGSGSTSVEVEGAAITNVCADENNVYYLQYGNVWSVPREKPLTVEDDPDEKYAAVRVLNATVSGSDAGVSRVTGFTVSGGKMTYWGQNTSGGYDILTRDLGSYSSTLLHSGKITNVQVYRDCVYYVGRDEADNGLLCSVSFLTGEKKTVYEKPVNFYVLSSGNAFVCRYIEGKNTLIQLNLSNGKIKDSWVIGEIDGMIANDSWIYYYTNSEMTGGDIYRMKPGSGDSVRIFHDSDRIMLTGIAGDYFGVYTKTGSTPEDRLTNAVYYLFNAETRERVI